MLSTIRLFVVAEMALFFVASLIHRGVLSAGYEHREAGIAEGVIGVVLLAALTAMLVWPMSARRVAIAAQAFALLGTMVGVVMIAIGVGPRTVPDVVFHAVLVILLVSGLVVTIRAARRAPARSA